MSSTLPGHGHRPALDGLRAISVIMIMLFHVPLAWVNGGYWAVNVFFIVSGYLITTLLVREYDTWGSIDLVGFYQRRMRRLMPALLLLLAVVALVAPRVLGSQTPATLRGDGIASLFYVANWRMILTGQSYFEAFGSPSPFRHLWTLAIEEQFYLLFPMLFLLLMRWFGRRRSGAVVVVAVLIAASALAMAMLDTGGDPSRIYYGTDTRMQDVLWGCLVALVLSRLGRQRVRELAERRTLWWVVGAVGAALCAAAILFVPAQGAFRGGYLLFDGVFAVTMVAVEFLPRAGIGRVLSWRPLVWIGQLSYGLYLWHWPIFVLVDPTRTGLSTVPLLVLRLGLTFALASASYYAIENPIRRGALRRRGKPIAWGAAVAAVAATALAIGVSTVGVSLAPHVQAGQAAQQTVGSGKTPVLIVGDSVGFSLGYHFPTDRFPQYRATARVNFGCGTAEQHLAFRGEPQRGSQQQDCGDIFADWQDGLRATQPQLIVWSLGGWEVFDHVVNGEVLQVGTPAYASYLSSRLELGLQALSPSNAPVVIPAVPCYRQKSIVVGGADLAPDRNDPRRAAAVNAVLRSFAQRHPDRVHVPDTGQLLCPGGRYVDPLNGVQMRDDGVHYTQAGTGRFWDWLIPQAQAWMR